MWRPYTLEMAQHDFPLAYPLCEIKEIQMNPKVKVCSRYPDCRYMDTDETMLLNHYSTAHELQRPILTDDDRKAEVLSSVPDEVVQCPWCFTKLQKRAVLSFGADGKLSKMGLCRKDAGGCGRRMQLDSMTKTRDAREFGRWFGHYPSRFKIIETETPLTVEQWFVLLKRNFPDRLSTRFWDGYGEANPDWKRKKDAERQAKEYEREQSKAEPDTDQVDEFGK